MATRNFCSLQLMPLHPLYCLPRLPGVARLTACAHARQMSPTTTSSTTCPTTRDRLRRRPPSGRRPAVRRVTTGRRATAASPPPPRPPSPPAAPPVRPAPTPPPRTCFSARSSLGAPETTPAVAYGTGRTAVDVAPLTVCCRRRRMNVRHVYCIRRRQRSPVSCCRRPTEVWARAESTMFHRIRLLLTENEAKEAAAAAC